MSLVSDIIRDAYRESNINAIGVAPTAAQQTESIVLLNRIVSSCMGNEIGEKFIPYPVGGHNISKPSGFPWYGQDPTGYWPIPINSRVMLNLERAEDLYLPPLPEDGSRFAVQDLSNNLNTYNVTVHGNGRLIDGATTLVLNTVGFAAEYFYRDDIGTWIKSSPLTYNDTFPFPNDFDDFFIIALAMRLNPRNGAALDPQSQAVFQNALSGLRSRYDQIVSQPSELGLVRTPGTRRSRNYGGQFANDLFSSGYPYPGFYF